MVAMYMLAEWWELLAVFAIGVCLLGGAWWRLRNE